MRDSLGSRLHEWFASSNPRTPLPVLQAKQPVFKHQMPLLTRIVLICFGICAVLIGLFFLVPALAMLLL